VKKLLAQTPFELGKMRPEEINREILRTGMIAELDAVNLYEQLAAMASDELIKKVFLDIAKEEKTHAGEFQALLLKWDEEQLEELEKGKEEVEEIAQEK
jgi:rubrerythrin